MGFLQKTHKTLIFKIEDSKSKISNKFKKKEQVAKWNIKKNYILLTILWRESGKSWVRQSPESIAPVAAPAPSPPPPWGWAWAAALQLFPSISISHQNSLIHNPKSQILASIEGTKAIFFWNFRKFRTREIFECVRNQKVQKSWNSSYIYTTFRSTKLGKKINVIKSEYCQRGSFWCV